MQLTGQNMHNEHAQCDLRGDRNFKGSDSSDPFVYFIFCGICSPLKEAWPLLEKRGDFEILKAWKQVLTTSERQFHKQCVIKIVGDFVYLKNGKVGEEIKQSYVRTTLSA